MTRNIVRVEQNKTALEAARLMTETSISSLIVHDDDRNAIGRMHMDQCRPRI